MFEGYCSQCGNYTFDGPWLSDPKDSKKLEFICCHCLEEER